MYIFGKTIMLFTPLTYMYNDQILLIALLIFFRIKTSQDLYWPCCSFLWLTDMCFNIRVFHKFSEIGNNAIIGIRGFTT